MNNLQLQEVQDEFIQGWGSLASQWGINKTMAQISAFLISSDKPRTTDDIMEKLAISRGNAHSNIKELVDWGFAQNVIIKGQRKDYYSCDQDPWTILCTIAKKRKDKEIDPAIKVLSSCLEKSSKLKDKQSVDFHNRIKEINEFLTLSSEIMNKVGNSEKSKILKWLFKLIGKN